MTENDLLLKKLDEHCELDRQQFEKIGSRLDDIQIDVKEIKLLLTGNKDYGIKGFIEQSTENSEWIKKAKWTIILIGMAITAASFMVSQIPQYLVNHAK